MRYNELTIKNAKDLVFGNAPYPVTTGRGLVIGGGTVYPELNFTLPPISIEEKNMETIKKHYKEIVTEASKRAMELHAPGIVFEFETLLEMTMTPSIGISLVAVMNEICEENYRKHGFKSEIRLTPNDTREFERPPRVRTSSYLPAMWELFEKGAEAGGNILSIESTGGKELCDDAILYGDIKGVAFALDVLGVRDMRFLWKQIVEIANRTGRIPGGDTACGFGNTAMVLADKGMIAKTFSALVRVLTIPRTLVALEEGAKGPDKDCGYEGPFLKAITGRPISMEGRTSACAHLSPVGNVAGACCDLWSNESVQNVKLLGGMAPTVSTEQLIYDARLFNRATEAGADAVATLQHLFVESDVHYDPQALILAPENVIAISEEIVKGKNHVQAGKRGALKALAIIEEAWKNGSLQIDERETLFIDMLRDDLSSIPDEEDAFIEQMLPTLDKSKVLLDEYGIR